MRLVPIAVLLCACGGARPAPREPSDPAVKPLPAHEERLSAPIASQPAASGVVTVARPLLGRVTTGDEIKLLVHWQLASGWIPDDNPLAHRSYDVRNLAQRLTVRVEAPGASATTHSLTDVAASRETTLSHNPTIELILRHPDSRFPPLTMHGSVVGKSWSDRPPSFDAPGTYWVTVSGEIPFTDGGEHFTTAPIPIRVVEPSDTFLSARELGRRADRTARKRLGVEKFDETRGVFDLPNRNRVVTVGVWSDVRSSKLWQLEVTPAGDVVRMIESSSYVPDVPNAETREYTDVWFRSFETFETFETP